MAEIYTCQNPDELHSIASALIKYHEDKRIFAFHGEMGAGKTTFIKTICNYLKVTDTVSSPTFAIINEYISKTQKKIYHFDFYRIKKIEEAFDLGYEEYFYSDNLVLIEWPEMIEELLPENCLKVTIIEISETEREISFEE